MGPEQAVRGFGVAAGEALFVYYSPAVAVAELEELKTAVSNQAAGQRTGTPRDWPSEQSSHHSETDACVSSCSEDRATA